ncbi:aminopeptidase N-like [Ischnura elegans]|uniref:aminopeptidase N-like n=1 Tax=Ischnura elegans TaxID=197161 RepID=UPI001ED86B77|nr:aminopeptidase N-like [Ischnura elegans]
MAVTHFEPTNARKAFPCFDEPNLKANFTISIARDKDMISLSNMPALGPPAADPRLPDNYVWDHYAETPKMSTYLVAFIVTQFKANIGEEGDIRVWSREEAVEDTSYSLEVTRDALNVMRNLTNIPYTLPKLDLVAIPDFQAGAMENWGLITFREIVLLYRNGSSTFEEKQEWTAVVAHEVAHQWFGNLVTPEWWKFSWIKEGFATYFQYAIVDLMHPSWRMMEQFVPQQQHTEFTSDALDRPHPISADVITVDRINAMLDEITYNKGACLARMMEHFLSRNTFFGGIQKYLNSRNHNSGNDLQLFSCLDSQAREDGSMPEGITVKEVMDTWAYQRGYPVVTIKRNYENDDVVITQERYVLKLNGTSDNYRWWIPLTYTLQSSPNFEETRVKIWVPNTDEYIAKISTNSNEWLMVNIQETGYYRVNYDDTNWNLITNYLKGGDFLDIHPVNRAQLVDDSFNLARAGCLPYHAALDLSLYLSKETDFIPWSSADMAFRFLDRRLARSKGYPMLKARILKTPNAYCSGIYDGGKEEWDFLWMVYEATTDPTETAHILDALGCSRDKEILKGYLLKVIEDDVQIRKHELERVFVAVSKNVGVDLSVDFLVENFEIINARYTSKSIAAVISGLASDIGSKEKAIQGAEYTGKKNIKMKLNILLAIAFFIGSAAAFASIGKKASAKLYERDGDKIDSDYYRLPKNILPIHYDLKIIPTIEVGNFSFKGSVVIQFLVRETTDTITLHSNGLEITEHILNTLNIKDVNIGISNITQDVERDFHVLFLDENLAEGSTYTLKMIFNGILKDDLDGFYISSYENGNGETEYLAVTQFEPVSARKAFPCFDESHLKATFAVSVARPKNMVSLSNMPMESSTDEGEDLPPDYVLDIYEVTPKMSTYLVAFAVSKFVANPPDAEKTFRLWSRENAIDQTDFIVNEAPRVLDVMADITGINYTLPKMDLMAVPDFAAGAMENWGLLTFRETFLLYEKNSSTDYDKQMALTVTTHEMSHQWFGDLVSPTWWSYMWLNEAFATYWMYIVTDVLEPTWRLMEQFAVERTQAAFVPDAMEYSKSIVYDVINPKEEDYESMDIAYNKGSSVIRMMEHALSKDVLYRGIRRYLEERKFDSANQDMLFDAIQIEASEANVLPSFVSVADVWSSWTTQSGYPVITVNRMYSEGAAVVQQERFVLEDFDFNKEQRWWIPISFTSQSGSNFNDTSPDYWMPTSETSIYVNNLPQDDGWVIFNIQQTGYYRVNYDEENWKRIIDFFKSEYFHEIPPVNRGQLVDDALNLARGGYINYTLALNVTQFLARETDFIPWYSAYPLFDFLDMQMSESKSYDLFKVYMANLLNVQYEKLTFNESSSDDHVTRLGRLMILPRACKYNVGDCLLQAKTSFDVWSQTNVNTIPANIRDTAYCYGVAMGGQEEWNFLWNAYESTTTASERARIMGALGCSTDEDILIGYLNKTVENDSKIRLQDQALVFSSVYSRADGLGVTLKFLTDRYNDIIEMGGESLADGIILGVSSRITTTEKATQMEEFLRGHDVSQTTAAKSKKFIDSNMLWSKKYEKTVEDWLKDISNTFVDIESS